LPISKVRTIFQVPVEPLRVNVPEGIASLRTKDLSFLGEETQHGTHAIHPYVSAINPPLARELINAYLPSHGSVLDPFCGGGGVLVECLLAGRSCAGGEINPLAVLISKAKTTYVNRDRLQHQFTSVQENAHGILGTVHWRPSKQASYWFKRYMFEPLAALKAAIDPIEEGDVKTLIKVVFSATIRDVMLTHRGEVRLRKLAGEDYEHFHPNVFDRFQKRAELATERVSSLPEGSRADVDIRDARSLDYESNSFDAIVCSPPYADDKNGVSYFQFSRNMLEWLGYSSAQISQYKNKHLGGDKDGRLPPSSETLAACLDFVKRRNDQHHREAVAFYADYYKALQEMKRVAKTWVIVVIGNRVLSRTYFDNGHITVEFVKDLGLELHHYYQRRLPKKRIPDLGYDGGGTSTEHILVFRK
jgi:site-specific DNA-methyltransferase (cytosine-N4-specific)